MMWTMEFALPKLTFLFPSIPWDYLCPLWTREAAMLPCCLLHPPEPPLLRADPKTSKEAKSTDR